jgi:hypothetical protein
MKTSPLYWYYTIGLFTGIILTLSFGFAYVKYQEKKFLEEQTKTVEAWTDKYNKALGCSDDVKSELAFTKQSLEVFKSIAAASLQDVDKKAIAEAPPLNIILSEAGITNKVSKKKVK